MFIMENTGRKISTARRAKNMTQMELADRLNISFQAVSNWERGVSMPDISKLPELSDLLGVSIDELLGKPSALVKGLIDGDTDAFLQENAVDPAELVEAAPILKPEQMDKVFASAREDFDDTALEALLPFLGQEACDELFERHCAREDISKAVRFAPFAGREKVEAMVARCAREGKDVVSLLPFSGEAANDAAARAVFEARGAGAVHAYLPFLSDETLFQFAMDECAARGLHGALPFAPFLKEEQVTELAKLAAEKGGMKAILPLVPFMDSDFLKKNWKNFL